VVPLDEEQPFVQNKTLQTRSTAVLQSIRRMFPLPKSGWLNEWAILYKKKINTFFFFLPCIHS
jgi:hypothetical protein